MARERDETDLENEKRRAEILIEYKAKGTLESDHRHLSFADICELFEDEYGKTERPDDI